MANEFLKSEIRKIKRNTEINFHTGNYIFIAKKIKSPLAKVFEKINKENVSGMDYETSQKQYSAYQKLMKELKRKNPKQFGDVYGSL